MRIETLRQRLPDDLRLCGLTYDSGQASVWEAWLSDEERACRTSFGSEKRKREFLLGRAAARWALSQVLDEPPADVPLRIADDGAVEVKREGWHVSIAHSGPHAVAVCAPRVVGVDLEQIQPRDPALRRFLFAPEDRSIPDRLPYDPNEALLLCWTLKEAVLKARRSGFRTSPKELRLDVAPAKQRAQIDVTDGGRWQLWFERMDECWGAVALAMETSPTDEETPVR